MLNEITKLLNVPTQEEDLPIYHISNDINNIDNDTLVFHINKKEELNSQQFNLLNNCFIVTDQPILINENKASCFFHVLDVEMAYRVFVNYYRELFNIPVVAITGTCGKTTTKEMITQILEKKFNVAKTRGNINRLDKDFNYLLSIDEETNYAVFETAISYPGDLIYGCRFFKPTIGVITNIGIDHLSGCKTIDNYIRTKGELLAGLNYQGILIINNDDESIKKINFSPFKGKILTYGINNTSDYQAIDILYQKNGMSFTIKVKELCYPVYIPGYGNHNVYNAVASLAVLDQLGINLEEAIEAIANIEYISSHLAFHKGIKNSTIVDDTWSSNPTSMEAAFAVLKEMGKNKVKIAVLGKISYLGDYALEQYEKIGKMIVDYGIDVLITLDSFSKQIGKSAINYEMKNNRIIHCKNELDLKETIEALLDVNTIVLFKVSMFEKKVQKLIQDFIET